MDKITHQVRCEQWTKIIKECLASGMNKTAWCREHGISDKSFFYWQRRLREEAYISTIKASFAPTVKEVRVPTKKTVDFVEVRMTDQSDKCSNVFEPDIIIRVNAQSDIWRKEMDITEVELPKYNADGIDADAFQEGADRHYRFVKNYLAGKGINYL